MAALAQEATTRRKTGKRGPGTVLAFLLLMVPGITLSGCALTEGSLIPGIGEKQPALVRQIVANWHNQVAFVPDAFNEGRPTPALVGRVYLFGPELSFPLLGDGTLVVKFQPLLPDNVPGPRPEARTVTFDKDTLRKSCLKEDMIGLGYTLPLPWPDYRLEITKVEIMVRYEDGKGMPVYSDTSIVILRNDSVEKPLVHNYQETGNGILVSGSKPGAGSVPPANGPQAAAAPAGTTLQSAMR